MQRRKDACFSSITLPHTNMFHEQNYFASHSMNQTVRIVRDKLDKVFYPAT